MSDKEKTEANAASSGLDRAKFEKDQAELQDKIKKALNPDGDKPQVDEKVNSTFEYIRDAIGKMENSEDRDKTANEIAEDLKSKMERWAASVKEKEAASSAAAEGAGSEAGSETGKDSQDAQGTEK